MTGCFSSSSVPAESWGALVVVLAVGTIWFTVHDSPQRGHTSSSSQGLDPFQIHMLLWNGPDLETQWTCTHLNIDRWVWSIRCQIPQENSSMFVVLSQKWSLVKSSTIQSLVICVETCSKVNLRHVSVVVTEWDAKRWISLFMQENNFQLCVLSL